MSNGNSQERADRLRAALKENLKRRKAQARARKVASAAGSDDPAPQVSRERDKPSD